MICEVSGRDCPTLDEHHVIPREFGGKDGPTVRIDPAIHQAIHRYCRNKRKLASFLASYPENVRARIQVLVTAIIEAESNLERARSYTLTLELTEEEYKKLTRLAKDNRSTETKIAKTLLSNLLSR